MNSASVKKTVPNFKFYPSVLPFPGRHFYFPTRGVLAPTMPCFSTARLCERGRGGHCISTPAWETTRRILPTSFQASTAIPVRFFFGPVKTDSLLSLRAVGQSSYRWKPSPLTKFAANSPIRELLKGEGGRTANVGSS